MRTTARQRAGTNLSGNVEDGLVRGDLVLVAAGKVGDLDDGAALFLGGRARPRHPVLVVKLHSLCIFCRSSGWGRST